MDDLDRRAVSSLRRFRLGDTSDTKAGEYKKFTWFAYQCMNPKCYTKNELENKASSTSGVPAYRQSHTCIHFNHFMNNQLDMVASPLEYSDDSDNGEAVTTVVVPMLRMTSWTEAFKRNSEQTLPFFGIHFPDYVGRPDSTTKNDPVTGELWIGAPRVSGGRGIGWNYIVRTKLENGVTFGSPRNLSLLSARKIGFSGLVTNYFEGVHCENTMHDVVGGNPALRMGSDRKIKYGYHRDMNVLLDVARIALFGECNACATRKESPVGLADF